MYRNFVKRVLDFVVSLIAFFLLSPFFIVLVILLSIANQGKPFFFQRRPGRKEKVFMLVKFRTMNMRRDAEGKLLPDEKRLTAIGKFVRKTSMDEIPQLLNVIMGDMSLVGPRPLLVEYLPLYSEAQRHRHDVRPGITGWAQVNGRNAISWERKFELDVWYTKNLSFLLDCKILLLTVFKVFKSEGISQQGHSTMPFFEGVKKS